MILTSFGGARNVTGSKHLLELNGRRVLLDCGMFQGHREESARRNRTLGFDPLTVDAVILSHAHIDHSGLLPMLAKAGYQGPIYCTHATRDLCSIMLLDSAHIQKRDAEWLSKKHMHFVPPPYDADDVRAIMKRFVSVSTDMPLPVLPDMTVTFREAGHVLGSTMLELDYTDNGRKRKMIFSGDIGRKNMPILKDPWEPCEADVVLMEGTYGDRDHGEFQHAEHRLAQLVHDAVERGGKILIPSFALERAQEIIYSLKRLEMQDAIPEIPVYVDSPLTVNVTHIFRLHAECFDEEFAHTMQEAGDPFELRRIRYISALHESMTLNHLKGPAIIIAASGMCEHGRIVHHIKNHCQDPNNTILIVGFQANYTLGRRIVERRRTIRMLGVERELNARVVILNEFSAHAGRTDLLAYGARFKDCAEKILLVHGEVPALEALQRGLQGLGANQVQIMDEGVSIEV